MPAISLIVIGSPSRDQSYQLQFVTAANCRLKDANTIWLVERTGYEVYGVPPSTIKMEAPPGGCGRYTRQEIEYILTTAFTGFAAARLESWQVSPQPAEVVVHTGFWGCGAYGGNRILMALLQLFGARLSRLDRLVFHTGDEAGSQAYSTASQTFQQVVQCGSQPRQVPDMVSQIESMGFQWGVGDGN